MVAQVYRNGFLESVHRGLVAVTRPDGRVIFNRGDPETPILPRSSAKPIQALAMVRCGLELPPDQLAVACASHSGEAFHLDAVRSILSGAGLDEGALQNTPDYPLTDAHRITWIAAGHPMSSLAQNCSGKHAAMLATCRHNQWPLETYLTRGHPLQQAVAETIRSLGVPIITTSTDGCGAPIQAIALADLARIFGRLAAATEGAEREVADAMRHYPQNVGGTGRDVTDLMQSVPGVIAKDGAEGVYAVGLPDGRGIAIKISDGTPRACPVVMSAVLQRHWIGDSALRTRLSRQSILGHGHPVGAVVSAGI